MKLSVIIICCIFCLSGFAQTPDSVYAPNIRAPQLYVSGNQLGYPILRLNSSDRLELHFDDLDANVKSYYFTYQLCNADWTPAQISEFDYLRGFSQVRISTYRFSSIALTRYTHYQAVVPDNNSAPTRSGNYMLKVFLDGDTSRLAFTRRFLVLEEGASVAAQILQPSNPQIFQTHQKIQINLDVRSLNIVNAFQQIKVVVLQNNRWDNALHLDRPTFYSGSNFEYNNDDNTVFPAGKQWRWLDIQSFRYQSDRVLHADYSKNSTSIIVRPDPDRSHQAYYFFNDINGSFYIQSSENVNPLWQTDYATVHFSFVPPGNIPFPDKDVYLLVKLTDYWLNDSTRMNFNAERGMYETAVLLKQGYYNYMYVTVDRKDRSGTPSFEFTEGNNLETENDYNVLVYYRQLGGRADQLVGMATLNTLSGRQ